MTSRSVVLDLADAAAAAPVVAARTGLPVSRVLAGLSGGRPLTDPPGCPAGTLGSLARAAADPGHRAGDRAARAATAAALLATFGLQARVTRRRLRRVLQVHHDGRRLTLPLRRGAVKVTAGDTTLKYAVVLPRPWDPWDVCEAVATVLDVSLARPEPQPRPADEAGRVADDVTAVLAAGAVFYTPEAAATITALADALVRLAELPAAPPSTPPAASQARDRARDGEVTRHLDRLG